MIKETPTTEQTTATTIVMVVELLSDFLIAFYMVPVLVESPLFGCSY